MLTLIKAGIYTTIQDNGRFLGAHLGIPSSGVMDGQSAEMANLLLGNELDDALLECTFSGPTIIFHEPTLITIVGAKIPVILNNNPINTLKALKIKEGDILSFGKIEKGCRFYIGIKGGFQSEVVYGSRSVCITGGILKQQKNGAQLRYNPYLEEMTSSVSIQRLLGNTTLSVYPGPEYSLLSNESKDRLLESEYTVLPTSNRMAYRVKHSMDLSHAHSIISSGTLPGTVQLTPFGEMIFLMRDAQTTGGYPRILQLSEESINNLSQLSANDSFTLQLI